MPESNETILARVDAKVSALHDELIGSPSREGRIPKLEDVQEDHAKQISFWKGAIAVIGFLLLAFGTVLFAHMLGGK